MVAEIRKAEAGPVAHISSEEVDKLLAVVVVVVVLVGSIRHSLSVLETTHICSTLAFVE